MNTTQIYLPSELVIQYRQLGYIKITDHYDYGRHIKEEEIPILIDIKPLFKDYNHPIFLVDEKLEEMIITKMILKLLTSSTRHNREYNGWLHNIRKKVKKQLNK